MPSKAGWWTCCVCCREVDPRFWGQDCPDCQHACCSTRTERSSIKKRQQASKRHLHIYLNEYLVDNACADTGCDINCITEAFARKLGLAVTTSQEVVKLPIKGRSMTTVGSTEIILRFPRKPYMPMRWKFSVFPKLASDVICGLRFLRATLTLENYQDRLCDCIVSMKTTPQVRSLGGMGENLMCWLNGMPALALPDTGAELSIMSLEFAKSLGYHDECGGKPFDTRNGDEIELADGSIYKSCGTIDIVLSCLEPSKIQSKDSIAKLENVRDPTKARLKSVSAKPLSIVIETFHVFNNLEHDIILGETVLAVLDAYRQHASQFGTSFRQQPCVAIGIRRKAGEGFAKRHTPVTDEARLREEFSKQSDLHLKRIKEIKSQANHEIITKEREHVLINAEVKAYQDWESQHNPATPQVNLIKIYVKSQHVIWEQEYRRGGGDCQIY